MKNLKIFKSSVLSCVMGYYYLHLHEWSKYQIGQKRKPNTIAKAVSYANRQINGIPIGKSSNVDSFFQQKFINTYNDMNSHKSRSKSGKITVKDYNIIINYAKRLNKLNLKFVGEY